MPPPPPRDEHELRVRAFGLEGRSIAALAAATGPVAVDAERASGYRYSQRAYLVQLRRGSNDIVLIDPIACPDLTGVNDALAGVEWIFHAASQDLPCLAGVGMVPERICSMAFSCCARACAINALIFA